MTRTKSGSKGSEALTPPVPAPGEDRGTNWLRTSRVMLTVSGLFDPRYYRDTNPDLRFETMDPAEHFLLHGVHQGRKPNRLFDPFYYLQNAPEAARSGQNALLHYLETGERQGFRPSPLFDPA
ncbi:MAG: hypothetical protein CTY25_03630 [Methylobacterium sp.]|nr:MAG: hypothetical protein CTY25_03630 [Methylobacterium sp.]